MPFFIASAHAQDLSTWWHGAYVSADTDGCSANDSLTIFENDGVYPWETTCTISLQTDIRDMQGVLLDIECSYPDSAEDGYNDRLALLELSDGQVMEYSRMSKQSRTLRRCRGR